MVTDLKHQLYTLLGRSIVPPDLELLNASVNGKVVLVSGAGGSIGSELCQQIIKLQARALILFECSEYNLCRTYRALKTQLDHEKKTVALRAILGSVLDTVLLKKVFIRYQVNVVFHAAAYKHVPVLESNVLAGIANNVFGTQNMIDAAACTGSDQFVLISTDKAVNPVSVMGVSKRIAELIVQHSALLANQLTCCAVRFGNVLDSSGSVVELFREQIREGGPLTITDARMERYFMMPCESAQLVMQACVLASTGDILVLDMGEPVSILTLAHKLVACLGYTLKTTDDTQSNIALEFIGMRPGEKLQEKLSYGRCQKTTHAKIMRCCDGKPDVFDLNDFLGQLSAFCKSGNTRSTIDLISSNFPSFKATYSGKGTMSVLETNDA